MVVQCVGREPLADAHADSCGRGARSATLTGGRRCAMGGDGSGSVRHQLRGRRFCARHHAGMGAAGVGDVALRRQRLVAAVDDCPDARQIGSPLWTHRRRRPSVLRLVQFAAGHAAREVPRCAAGSLTARLAIGNDGRHVIDVFVRRRNADADLAVRPTSGFAIGGRRDRPGAVRRGRSLDAPETPLSDLQNAANSPPIPGARCRRRPLRPHTHRHIRLPVRPSPVRRSSRVLRPGRAPLRRARPRPLRGHCPCRRSRS